MLVCETSILLFVDGLKIQENKEMSFLNFFFIFYLFFCFLETGFFCVASPGYPGTHSVVQASLELRDPSASASQMLGLKACATTAQLFLNLLAFLLTFL